jgi:hypothetical protein
MAVRVGNSDPPPQDLGNRLGVLFVSFVFFSGWRCHRSSCSQAKMPRRRRHTTHRTLRVRALRPGRLWRTNTLPGFQNSDRFRDPQRPLSLRGGNRSSCPHRSYSSPPVAAVSSGRLSSGKLSFVSRYQFCPKVCQTERPRDSLPDWAATSNLDDFRSSHSNT